MIAILKFSIKQKEMKITEYPFVQELIADPSGNISKVILSLDDYQKIIQILEDQALYHAMLETASESPLNLESALEELEKE